MERREFLALTCAASAASLLPNPLGAGESLAQTGRSVSCNAGWQLCRAESSTNAEGALLSGTEFNSASWETVDLPHTARVEVESPNLYFQGICWYRKHFAVDPSWKGRRVALKFEAAMQLADVWVNGKHKLTHLGGYRRCCSMR
jgi:beta-galactosidase